MSAGMVYTYSSIWSDYSAWKQAFHAHRVSYSVPGVIGWGTGNSGEIVVIKTANNDRDDKP